METEIVRRSVELQNMNKALRAANEAKNEFLSRMSHELRTPLAAIMGFSELLRLADLDEEKRKWAAMIHRAGEHLLALVNEVLDLSRIESGHLFDLVGAGGRRAFARGSARAGQAAGGSQDDPHPPSRDANRRRLRPGRQPAPQTSPDQPPLERDQVQP
jgi:signal transduction histidine kinase